MSSVSSRPKKWGGSSKKLSSVVGRLKSVLSAFPQVESPVGEVQLTDKALWTVGALVVFLWACQVPLYGVAKDDSPDPLYWYRDALASHRGTLMELGISPIVTSSLVMQLLVGSRLITLDFNKKEDTVLFKNTQKACALVITFGEALAYVCSGMYGSFADLGLANGVLILLQLLMAGVMVILLDELLQRGYGVGSGITLFIAANMCQAIVWAALSPATQDTVTGPQYYGALPALFHLIISRKSMVDALKQAFYRSYLPNLMQLVSTLLVFIITIYFQAFRVDLPVKNQKVRGVQSTAKYPIKLFYTSNMPVILQTALVSNMHFLARIVASFFGDGNLVAGVLGKWSVDRYGVSRAVGGVVYYMSPPRRLMDVLSDPIHALIYVVFVVSSCSLFSLTWIQVSGTASKDVAKQLKEQSLVVKGYREHATVSVLERYIPVAAACGGMCLALLTLFADFVGAIGGGSGILLAVTILFEIFESATREAYKQGYQIPSLT